MFYKLTKFRLEIAKEILLAFIALIFLLGVCISVAVEVYAIFLDPATLNF